MAAKKNPPLNGKQLRFVQEYVKDFNGTAAYKRAGYTASQKSAETNAARLLGNARVAEAVAKAAQKVQAQVEFTAEVAIKQLERMVTFDARKLFHHNGQPKEISELDDDTAAVIGGLDVHEEYRGTGAERQFVGYVKKYKLTDKLGAVNTALKMFGKLNDRVEHTGKDGGPIQTQDLSENDAARRFLFAMSQAISKVKAD
jgi:phage terminase small subunit